MTLELLTLLSLLLGAQAPAPNTAKVSGIVINQVTKEPIDGAEVRLKPSAGAARTSSTDSAGKFTIEDLGAQSFDINISRSGFVTPETSAGLRHLALKPGENLKDLYFELAPSAAITGRVSDENGKPLTPAIVVAIKVEYVNGRRVLLPGGLMSKLLYLPFGPDPTSREVTSEQQTVLPSVRQARANDQGDYRIFGLEPGEYYVAIWQKGGQNPTTDLPPIYYPGVNDPAAAVPIRIKGTDLPGMNIQVPTMENHSVRFKVSAPTTMPFNCVNLNFPNFPKLLAFMLVQHTADLDIVHFATLGDGLARDPSNDNATSARLHSIGGNFWETSKLAPGSYEIYHASCVGPGVSIVGRLSFDIGNRDVDAGTLTVPVSSILRGQVRNPSNVPVALDRLYLRLRPTDWRGLVPGMAPNPTPVGRKTVKADGTFAFEVDWSDAKINPMIWGSVAPGHYQVDVGGLPPDAYVESIRYAAKESRGSGIDATEEDLGPIEITLGAPGGIVKGIVRNKKGDIVPDAKVALVSQDLDAASPLSPTADTDQYGAFSFQRIAPGSYGVFAWTSVPSAAYNDKRFMQPLQSRGTKVQVEKGSTANLELRVIGED